MARLFTIIIMTLLFSQASPGWSQIDLLVCDVPYSGRISAIGESDLVGFNVSADEKISIIIAKSPPAGAGFLPYWRLLDRNGNPAASCGSFTPSSQVDCGPLPVSGSPYYIEITDLGNNDTGDYRIQLQRLTGEFVCENIPLECDVVFTGVLSDPVDSDLFSFTVSENEKFTLDLVRGPASGAKFQPAWRLLNRDGNPAVLCDTRTSSRQVECGPLPVSGNPYRLEVTDINNDDTGEYRIHFQRLTAGLACEDSPLVCDVTFNGSIDDSLDSDLLSFSVPTNEIVTIEINRGPNSGMTFLPYWRILDRHGNPAVACSARTVSAQVGCGPLPPSGNPYRIDLSDFGKNDTGEYQVKINFQSGICAPPPPVLTSPPDGATNVAARSATFTWNPAIRATSYNLEISENAGFSPLFFSQDGIVGTSHMVGHLLHETKYYWRVKAANPGGTSAPSEPRSFTTVVMPPAPVVLQFPPDNATTVATDPLLRWNRARRADSYRVQVATTPSFAITVINQSGITDTLFMAQGLTNNVLYYWRVSAFNPGGDSTSSIWRFITILGPPALSLPLAGATCLASNPVLAWRAVRGANAYQLQVSQDNSFSVPTVNRIVSVDTSATISGLMHSTAYFWRVRSLNASDTSAWSVVRSFSTTLASPALISPAHNSIRTPTNLTLKWQPSAGATSYHFQIATDSSFANIVEDRSALARPTAVPENLNRGVRYYWRVNASNNDCSSDWSAIWRFRTEASLPLPPVLLSPVDGARGVPTNPTFEWQATDGAITYRIQIDTTTEFNSNLVLDSGGVKTNSISIGGLAIKTWHYWRVSASNEDTTGNWSPIWSFFTTDVSVKDRLAGVPTDFNLNQNYPNPFNPLTVIRYSLPQAVEVNLSIFNPLGKQIAVLVSRKQAPGEYEVHWQPVSLASGIYLYRLQAGKFTMTRKMVFMQ